MFSVIYRFKVKQGREKEFQECWSKATEEFCSIHGGLGSCLHITDDKLFIAYAKWPDRLTWEKEKKFKDISSFDGMNECIEEHYSPIPMTTLKDMLV